MPSQKFSRRTLIIIAGVLAVIGIFWIVLSRAATLPEAKLVQLEGRLHTYVEDNFEQQTASYQYFLETGPAEKLQVTFTGEQPAVMSGSLVQLRGVQAGGQLTVDLAQPTSLAVIENYLPRSSERKVAVIMFNFINDQRQPFSQDFLKKAVFTDLNAYFADTSYGIRQLSGIEDPTGDVFGWFTLNQLGPNGPGGSDCPVHDWAAEAQTKLQESRPGLNLDQYDHIVHVFPQSRCGWNGLAGLGGRTSWINGEADAETLVEVTGHELGHNFGIHHANSLFCTEQEAQVTLSTDCEEREYGDHFDIMGSNYDFRHFHAGYKKRLTWLKESQSRTITGGGSYTLYGSGRSSDQPSVLLIPRTINSNGTAQDYYSVEYRRPALYDLFDGEFADATKGVLIRVTDGHESARQARLLDMNPDPDDPDAHRLTSTFYDASLKPGQQFSDPANAVSIKLSSLTANYASVQIEMPAYSPADVTPPSQPANLQAVAGEQGVDLSWGAASDAESAVTYLVYRDGVHIGTSSRTSFGDTTTKGLSSYTYRVSARDQAGNESALSDTVTVTTPKRDFTPPPTPENFGASASDIQIALWWSPAEDDSGDPVTYRIYRNPSYSNGWGYKDWPGSRHNDSDIIIRGTSYTYQISAIDRSGNESPKTGPVTVKAKLVCVFNTCQ